MELGLFATLRPTTGDRPAYAQVRDQLRTLIDSGALPPGHRLPTERALAQLLEVSRITVRHATSALENEGRLIRRHGSGTYVAPPRVTAAAVTLTGFSSVLSDQGRDWHTRVLSAGFAAPDPAVLTALRVPNEANRVVRLVRVRYIDGIPSSLETSWLPASTAGPLLDEPLGDESLFQTLGRDGGFAPDHAAERLSAVGLDPAAARHLENRSGVPAFGLERTTYAADGRPLEFARTLLRADRFTFVNRRPDGARPLDPAVPS
ncbi:transcriptional regulator, GntR family [Nakamurella panacisegetis]|uniref:Transcriptional regulator, GntR family n=1 Tax=Nakamurella panacisegetis TaxID=1090615 RepID=A0A1H0PCW5_9ACTN|nr:GntR family transcriptional regulator [Nakamurella panacisegetis]SDP02851.1 transcriptional regulator, GntR family [Nakamurella panacisegetis]